MSNDELSPDDFKENDLPNRPLRFRPDYRRNVRQFLLISTLVGLFVLAVVVATSL